MSSTWCKNNYEIHVTFSLPEPPYNNLIELKSFIKFKLHLQKTFKFSHFIRFNEIRNIINSNQIKFRISVSRSISLNHYKIKVMLQSNRPFKIVCDTFVLFLTYFKDLVNILDIIVVLSVEN